MRDVKKILLLLIIGLQLRSTAQITAVFSDVFPDAAKTRIGLVGDFDINSNSITSKFFSKFYM